MSTLRRIVASAIVPLLLSSACSSPTTTPGSGTGPASYDGTWDVEVSVQTCQTITHTSSIEVKGGTFSHYLFTYCIDASGVRISGTTTCGTGRTQQVSIAGSMSGVHVSGNMFLSGSDCNGGNGFEGVIDPPYTSVV